MTEIKKLKEKSTIDLNKFSSKDNILAIAKLIVFFSILFIFYLISTNDIKILYYIEFLLIVTFFFLLKGGCDLCMLIFHDLLPLSQH